MSTIIPSTRNSDTSTNNLNISTEPSDAAARSSKISTGSGLGESTTTAEQQMLIIVTNELGETTQVDRGDIPAVNEYPSAQVIKDRIDAFKNEWVETRGRSSAISFTSPINESSFTRLVAKFSKSWTNVINGIKRVYTQVANGKVKQVWKQDDDPTHVLYTAINGKNTAAEAELKEEVNTATRIRNNLKPTFIDFIAKELVPLGLSEEPDTIGELSMLFSVQELKDKIFNPKELKRIPDGDLDKLKAYFNAPENKTAINQASKGQNLAIDIETVEENERINNSYTVRTSKADGDLEKLIREGEYTPKDQLDIISQVLSGMADLHEAGFLHGDIKPENVLYTRDANGELHVKISDFGKTQEIKYDKDGREKHSYCKGNTRFNPWENRLSQKGDVCSIGIALIRILEQKVLHQLRITDPTLRSLVPISADERAHGKAAQQKNGKWREGIEVYLIEHKASNAIEADESPEQAVLARWSQGFRTLAPKPLGPMGKAKDKYIDALTDGLKKIGFASPESIQKLTDFIKEMTDINSETRPTMAEAAKKFEKIQAEILQEYAGKPH